MAQSIDRQTTIAGRNFMLRFSIKAMTALGDAWGCKNLDETTARLSALQSSNKIDLVAAAQLLWASLRKHHPDLSIDQVEELLDENGLGNFQRVIDDLSMAIAASMPEQEAPAGKRPQKQKR